ncbi:MAG: AIR synthase family protein [Eubacterium sp.]|nr:AIR synthase family protein [Eubacterium sp.]
MQEGKLPEEVLVRSVLGQIKHRRQEVLYGPGVGADCAALQTDPDETLLFSTDPITGTAHGIGGHSIHITANDLAAAGAEPVAVLLTLLLPEGIEEADVAEMLADAERVCADLNMEILGGHTEITSVVNRPVITATGIGKCRKDSLLMPGNVHPGQDIIVTKWIGLEGSAILAADRESMLSERVSKETLETAKGFLKYLSVVPEARIAVKNGAVLMHDITEGGIMGALWEVAEFGNTGIRIVKSDIPLREETRRICAAVDADPYRIMSSGSMLIIAENGTNLVEELERAGICASIIGKTIQKKDRILVDGNEESELQSPEADHLYVALKH